MPIRVLIVDDHPVVRMGLRAMIEAEPDLAVAGEAGTGAEAVTAFERLAPDVTLMDLRMPGPSGVDAIRAIRARWRQARILVVTTYDADEDVFRALEAGAGGYVLKGTFREGMLEAVRAVHAGQTFVPPDIAARVAQRAAAPRLSAREVQVLELLARGLSNREIGGALSLAEDTVKNHLKRIFAKLDVSDRTEAVTVAVQRGIIRL